MKLAVVLGWQFLALTLSLIVNPICESCLTNVTYTLDNSSWSLVNSNFQSVTVQLTALSYSEIWFDFRQVDLDELYYNVSVLINDDVYNLSDTSGKASLYSLFVDADSTLSIHIDLDDDYAVNQQMFLQTTSITSIISDIKQPQVQSEFVWTINRQDVHHQLIQLINLPFNFIQQNVNVYLTKILDNNTTQTIGKSGAQVISNSQNDWGNSVTMSVPFIPYFSNCNSTGSQIYLTKETQDDQWCNIVPIDQIEPVNQLRFGMTPYSDSCNIQLSCMYDEDPSVHSEYPYWQTLTSGITLMSITKYKIPTDSYQSLSDDVQMIACIINTSEGSNNSNMYPSTVEMQLGYYQVSQTQSHLISCNINFGLYSTATANSSYSLTIKKKPLNHTYILIAFGFNNYVYIITFVLIGLISNLENIVLSVYHYVVSRKKRKPFKVRIYIRVMIGMFQGSLGAILPLLILLGLVNIVMVGELFSLQIYHFSGDGTQPHVFWDLITKQVYSDFSASEPTQIRAGRQGLALLILGTTIICVLAKWFIGCQRPKAESQPYSICGTIINPHLWLKSKFLFGTFMYVAIQLTLMYFAYTQLFSNNIWVFIVFTKILQMIMEQLTDLFYEDIMQCMPFKLITEFTSYLNTLAANDFYSFMFSFLIDVAMNMIEKAYVATLQKLASEWLKDKYIQLEEYVEKLLNDEEQQKQHVKDVDIGDNQDEDKEVFIVYGMGDVAVFDHIQQQYNELQNGSDVSEDDNERMFKQRLGDISLMKLRGETQRVIHQHELEESLKEKIQQNNMTLEFTADLFGMPLSLIVQPFAILTMWLTYNESLILQNYVIAEKFTTIYLLSAVMIGVFTVLNMVVLFFLLENYRGWDIEENIKRLLDNYDQRKNYWKGDDDNINLDFEVKLRSVDNFCLSSQFYFLVTGYVAGMFFMVVGVSTIVQQSYNPLIDSCSILVAIFWTVVTVLFVGLCKILARLANLWDYKRFYSKDTRVHCGSPEEDLDKEHVEGVDAENGSHQSSSVFLKNQINDSRLNPKKDIFVDSGTITDQDGDRNLQSHLDNYSDQIPYDESFHKESAGSSRNIDLRIPDMQRKVEEIKQIETKIKSLCKKLQPKFSDEKFRLQYSQKYKDFIKKNIERIISSVDHLPEIPQDILNYDNNTASAEEQQTNKKIQVSKEMQNVLSMWLHETRRDQEIRKNRGLETEKFIKKCNFCFNSWGIYYGYGGICLECNQLLLKKKQQ